MIIDPIRGGISSHPTMIRLLSFHSTLLFGVDDVSAA